MASCAQEVDRLAAGLLTLGLNPGDRIGIWSPNNSEWVLTQFATAKAGLDPGQHQSGLSHRRARIRAQQSRLQGAHSRRAFQDLGLCRHAARAGAGARPCATRQARIGAAAGAALGRSAWRRLASRHVPLLRNYDARRRGRSASASPSWRRSCNSTSRSTFSSPPAPPAFPKARRCRITTSSTTASSSARRCG